jgi:hypothetical protein
MLKCFTVSTVLSLAVIGSFAHAADESAARILEALNEVPMADIYEYEKGDELTLSTLQSIDSKDSKAKSEISERLVYWKLILSVASEDELIAAKTAVKERRAEQKTKLNEMSAIDASVYMARRDNPCDDIFLAAADMKKVD